MLMVCAAPLAAVMVTVWVKCAVFSAAALDRAPSSRETSCACVEVPGPEFGWAGVATWALLHAVSARTAPSAAAAARQLIMWFLPPGVGPIPRWTRIVAVCPAPEAPLKAPDKAPKAPLKA